MKFKTIGILGGMGPAASSELYSRILKYCQNEYDSIQDDEFPPIILYSLPLDGFDETGVINPAAVKAQLIDAMIKLEVAGCDLAVIACNTVHEFYGEIQSQVGLKVISIIDESVKKVIENGLSKVVVLSSQNTAELGLYQKALEASGIEALTPNIEEQRQLNHVIHRVMGGRQSLDDTIVIKEISREYINRGAQGIILGCTELPLAINEVQTDFVLIDTLQVAAEAAVRNAEIK